jgi:hypothetical protein
MDGLGQINGEIQVANGHLVLLPITATFHSSGITCCNILL